MIECSHHGCSWRAIAPATEAAWGQYADHLLADHSKTVEADIPEGMVQVKLGAEADWVTVSLEEAGELHAAAHDRAEPDD